MSPKPSAEKVKKEGCVYTKAWVAESMLDLIGYQETCDLSSKTIVEPSCGNGSFVVPIVKRLLASAKRYGRESADLRRAIAAFDLDLDAISAAKAAVSEILLGEGFSADVADSWFINGDFLLAEKIAADWVVGNPPYIRANNLDREMRSKYISSLKTMTMGTDIYVGFIEKGLASLKSNGQLCYICADRWMQNGYGSKLRAFVNASYSIDAVLKLNGVDCFVEKVSAYPAIIKMSFCQQTSTIYYADCESGFNENDIGRLIEYSLNEVPLSSDNCIGSVLSASTVFKEKGWVFGSSDVLDAISGIESRCHLGRDNGIEIGIGVATGSSSIYIVRENPGVEESRLLPTVLPEDVENGLPPERPMHWIVNPWEPDGSLVNLQNYPLLRNYFEANRSIIEKRHVAKEHQESWYRTIDKIKLPLLDREKLLIADLLLRAEPILDKGRFYPSHGFYWIASSIWDLEVLGGLLLSDLTNRFIEAKGVKMRGKTLRFQAQYLKMLYFPDYETIGENAKELLRKAFVNRDRDLANEGAIQAYRLSNHEKEVLGL